MHHRLFVCLKQILIINLPTTITSKRTVEQQEKIHMKNNWEKLQQNKQKQNNKLENIKTNLIFDVIPGKQDSLCITATTTTAQQKKNWVQFVTWTL